MNKNIFQHFHGYELLIKKAEKLLQYYQVTGWEAISDFYNPDEIEVLKKYFGDRCNYIIFGGYQNAIRKVLIFGDKTILSQSICCLTAKFNQQFNKLDNRDIKGAVYNLGIDVDKIGDFWLEENNIYLYCKNEIAEYLINNFKQIGRCHVNFAHSEFKEQNFKFETSTIISTSLRLDSIVASIIRKSREKSKDRIVSGLVNVNYHRIEQCDYICKINDIISLKKIGRYIIKDIQINKKSGKIILSIDKYI